MAIKNWTNEQKSVIDAENTNILTSAAAGSGKTAVLIERIIQMVLNDEKPVDIDSLLVVTFTKSAARSMKEKIAVAINEKMQEFPNNEHLKKQFYLLSSAHIQTIDSFCKTVISDYIFELPIAPGYRLMDENEAKLIQKNLSEEMIKDIAQNRQEQFGDFFRVFGKAKGFKEINEYMMSLYNKTRSFPFPKEWLEKQRALYDDRNIEEMTWMRESIIHLKKMLSNYPIQEQYDELFDIVSTPDAGLDYLYDFTEEDCEDMKVFIQTLDSFDTYEEMRDCIQAFSPKRLKSKPKHLTINDEVKKEYDLARKKILAPFKKGGHIERLLHYSLEEIGEDWFLCKEAVSLLVEMVLIFDENYQAYKIEKNLMDFGDLNRYALDLIVAHPEIAKSYQEKFYAIFIDEYQDSNLLQEELFKFISKEQQGMPNRFMVGDVKQSIYQFRQARPQLFMEKYDSYGDTAPNFLFELNKNFRSHKNILEPINDLFKQIMSAQLGGIHYNEQIALKPGLNFDEDDMQSRVEVLVLDTQKATGMKEDGKLIDIKDREWEARLIAYKIKRLIDLEEGVLVKDEETGELRRAEYKDIVILLRSVSNWSDIFLKVFKEENIPCYAEAKENYFDAVEVEFVLNYLRVLDNPKQDIPLICVMKSPVFGFSNEDLVVLRCLLAERGIKRNFHQVSRLIEMEKDTLSDNEHAIILRLKAFYEKIDEERMKLSFQPIHLYLQQFLEESGYLYYACALPMGKQRGANLERLVTTACDYEKTSFTGVFNFIRYIENLKEKEISVPIPLTLNENENVVRIMTIHKSKGLEYPIVFMSGTTKKANLTDASAYFLSNVDLGLVSNYTDPKKRLKRTTFMHEAVAQKIKNDAIAEELRLLYVALTRAKEYLFLTACSKTIEREKEKALSLGRTNEGKLFYADLVKSDKYFTWIWTAFAKQQNPLVKMVEYDVDALDISKSNEQVQYSAMKNQLRGEIEVEDLPSTVCEYWDKKLNDKYDYNVLEKMPATISVSEIKKNSQDMNGEYNEAALVKSHDEMYSQKMGGALYGTLVHSVMERLDYENKTAVDLSHYTKEQKEMLRRFSPKAFLENPFTERIKNAYQKEKLYREQPFLLGLTPKELEVYQPMKEKLTDCQLEGDDYVLIRGIIDMFFEEEDGFVLIDYKTDRINKENLQEEFSRRYKIQMDLYEMVICRCFSQKNKRVKERYVYSFYHETFVKI